MFIKKYIKLGDVMMETKFILGIIVVLALVGGVVGCNYVINNPAQPPATQQAPVAAENVNQQNITNDTNQVTTNNTTKANAETKTVKETCTKCKGKGYTICSACGGNGCKYVDCPTCKGNGKVTTENMVKITCYENPCPTCGGSGKLKEACTVCGGDGKIPCITCGGKGYKWVTVTQ